MYPFQVDMYSTHTTFNAKCRNDIYDTIVYLWTNFHPIISYLIGMDFILLANSQLFIAWMQGSLPILMEVTAIKHWLTFLDWKITDLLTLINCWRLPLIIQLHDIISTIDIFGFIDHRSVMWRLPLMPLIFFPLSLPFLEKYTYTGGKPSRWRWTSAQV